MISVIIPTRNRRELLTKCLTHLQNCPKPETDFEILVVDNNSTDNTKELVEEFSDSFSQVRYVFNEDNSLYSGRQVGLDEAQGELLAYIDDDSFVGESWLTALANIEVQDDITLATGPNIPLFESEPPHWLKYLKSNCQKGYWYGYLSLLDFGDEAMDLPPHFVWGCNFIVRKQAVIEAGSFHPDGVPLSEIHLRGDGESSLAMRVAALPGRTVYRPELRIQHFVSNQRMELDYLCKRSFSQGVSGAFAQLRRFNKCGDPDINVPEEFKENREDQLIAVEDSYRLAMISGAFAAGKHFQLSCADKNADLEEYILRPDKVGSFLEKPAITQFPLFNSDIPVPDCGRQLRGHVLWIWRNHCKNQKVALFGGGQHTRWFLKTLSEAGEGSLPEAIIDDNPTTEFIHDVPVIHSAIAANEKFDTVILSTDYLQNLFRQRVEDIFSEVPNIIDLYDGYPPGPYQKL